MILIAAIAVGLLAAFLVFNYVQGAEDRAQGDAQRVDVFVVRDQIPRGVSGNEAQEQNLIERDQIPREFLPPTAITSLDQIDGKVALNNLAPNQVLVDGMFVDAADAQVGFSELLDDDRTAITISVDQVRGVAGLLVPGDEVNIMLTQGGGTFEEDSVAERLPLNARFLYQKVRILAVGTTAAAQPGENLTEGADGEAAAPAEEIGDTGLITFSVPVEAAQYIASVTPESIYLTLVPESYEPTPLPPLGIEELTELPGEAGAQLTPYGPDGEPADEAD
ncbi:Flp pilus assembly protein CpaB [cyanobacterium TDX16]|nr:Flp pilus assembly protein CpaB [cyanobacterium TDX16]